MKRLHRTKGFTLVELLVVIGIIALLISILLPSLNRARETANRVKCAAALKSIGQALMLYANENKQLYPRTVYKGGTAGNVSPTWGTIPTGTNPFTGASGSVRPYDNDVTAAIYLLMSTQDVSPELFICPSSSAEKWDYGSGGNTVANWCNWNGLEGVGKNLSYSYQSPYSDDFANLSGFKLSTSLSSEYAVFADINPGGVSYETIPPGSTSDNVLFPDSKTTGKDVKYANSNNHGKDGQNILFGDGHVDFRTTAFAGIGGDNIYARASTSNTNGSNPSADSGEVYSGSFNKDDNVLLPTD